MPLNAQHCHTHLMKIAQFVLSFSTPTPEVINRERGDPNTLDDHALLNHATTGSGRDMTTFSAGPIRPRSARLVRNSANIKHAPIAVTL